MKINEITLIENAAAVGDAFGIELGDLLIETTISGFVPGGVLLESDSVMWNFFVTNNMLDKKSLISESAMSEVNQIFQDLAAGRRGITDVLNNPQDSTEKYAAARLQDMLDEVVSDLNLDLRVDHQEIMDELSNRISDEYGADSDEDDEIKPPIVSEAEYQGRKVPIGKPMRGDVKKFKVYVKNPKGNVVKVNFGDPNMRIKKSNPARRKSFRARHRCATAKDRTTARYWSCRKW